jgi:hypothetical protein
VLEFLSVVLTIVSCMVEVCAATALLSIKHRSASLLTRAAPATPGLQNLDIAAVLLGAAATLLAIRHLLGFVGAGISNLLVVPVMALWLGGTAIAWSGLGELAKAATSTSNKRHSYVFHRAITAR